MFTPRDRSPEWVAVGTESATAISRTLATYAVLQGLTVLLYGPDRWAGSPALQPAMQVPGRTTTWGAALALAGAIGLFGSVMRRMELTAVGHALAGLWSLFFAVSMLQFLLPGHAGPTTGALVYGTESVVFTVLAVGAWRLR